ncbi:MAG: transcription elongation factor GreAB [Verrucomicrobiota bacterium]|nr:transcription elongation factor GreAB [Verrucomicrobiota bacterium]
MDKAVVLEKIITSLQFELETYIRAAKFSHAEATAEENRAENKYDTRGLEASYLAAGQANKVVELEAAITSFKELKDKPANESVEIGALVELDQEGALELYFIGPTAGGTEVEVASTEILIITPESPLGSQLIGLEAGQKSTLDLAGRKQKCQVKLVC